MKNGRVPRKYIKDPLGKKYWPFFTGRDQARLPMQWNNLKNAGFSTGKSWIKPARDYILNNVKSRKEKYRSIYWYYRELLKLRKKYPALHQGAFKMIAEGQKGVLAYKRSYRNQEVIVLLNFKPYVKKISLEGIQAKVLLSTHLLKKIKMKFSNIRLNPYEATVLLLQDENI